MYQGTTGHTGYLPRSLLIDRLAPAWTVAAQAVPASGVAVAEGRVFTTPVTYFDESSPLVVQDLASGQIQWQLDFGDVFSVNPPAVQDGVVYLQTGSGFDGAPYIHAYSVQGEFRWRSRFDAQWEEYLAPIVVNGKLYFNGGTYGGMYAFDAATGEQDWFAGLPQYDRWSPTWADGRLVVYTDRLDVIDPEDGASVMTIEDPGHESSFYDAAQSPVVLGEMAYVTNGDRLVAFDLAHQSIAWSRTFGARGQVATDGRELFVSSYGVLTARDPATGSGLWAWVPSPTGSITGNIIVTDSHVIVGDGTTTYLVERTYHHAEATIPASGMLAYGGDRLVIAADDGQVHAWFLPTDEMFTSGFER